MSQEIRALRRWLWWRTREPKSITETQEGTRKYTFLFKLVTLFPLSPFSLQFTSQLKNHLLSQQIYNLVPVSALILCLLTHLFHFFLSSVCIHYQLWNTPKAGFTGWVWSKMRDRVSPFTQSAHGRAKVSFVNFLYSVQ